jgi:hypothetical protein
MGRAKMIRRWKPWEKSTGPKSAEGKKKVSQNACGQRALLQEIPQGLREHAEAFKSTEQRHRDGLKA